MISPAEFTHWQSLKDFEEKYTQFVRERPCGLQEVAGKRQKYIDVWAPQNSHTHNEGFVAIRVARNIGARSLRINPKDHKGPDFDFRLRNGRGISFQETRADFDGREIAREHRGWAAAGGSARPDPVEDWQARRREIGPAISRAIELKASKKYPPQTRLLIYLNLGTYGTWREEIEADIVRFCAPGLRWFSSVWVLWEGRLYRAAPNPFLGEPGMQRPRSFVQLGAWRHTPSIRCLFEDEAISRDLLSP